MNAAGLSNADGPSPNDLLHTVSLWIDSAPANRARDPEALLWGRAAKVGEEAGEVIAALVAAFGHNPRKPAATGLAQVEYELLDVAMTALCAVAHLHRDDPRPADVPGLLDRHIRTVAHRAGLTPAAD
ncbi:MazG-like family protein [Streptomyces sp. NPDC001889]